jgi:membrane fusion protein (multidrug efflux system)
MNKQNSTTKTDKIISRSTTFIASMVVVVLLIWGIVNLLDLYQYEQTEDAQLEAYINPLTARVSGFIKEIRYGENQKVKKGDTLLIIDSREYQLNQLQADAAVRNSKEQVEVITSNIKTARDLALVSRARISGAKSKLVRQQLEFGRFKKLFAAESATSQQMEQVKSDLEMAESEYQVALSNYSASNSKVKELQSQLSPLHSEIRKREISADRNALDLSYTVLTAPYDGKIGKRLIQVGQQIQIGQTLAFILDQQSGIWVVANFKETQLKNLHIGQDVKVHTDAFPDKEIWGKIESLSPATGARYSLLPPDNSTGNFVKIAQRIPVKINIDNRSKDLAFLSPGMNVTVSAPIK